MSSDIGTPIHDQLVRETWPLEYAEQPPHGSSPKKPDAGAAEDEPTATETNR